MVNILKKPKQMKESRQLDLKIILQYYQNTHNVSYCRPQRANVKKYKKIVYLIKLELWPKIRQIWIKLDNIDKLGQLDKLR